MPTLLVRGAWDSVCNDRDAVRLLQEIGDPTAARDCVLANEFLLARSS